LLPASRSAVIEFMRTSFSFIETGKAHVVAAAFAFGREHIIPLMFRALLERITSRSNKRRRSFIPAASHQMDEESHGPLTMLLLNELVAASRCVRQKQKQRLRRDQRPNPFLDGVLQAIEANVSARIS